MGLEGREETRDQVVGTIPEEGHMAYQGSLKGECRKVLEDRNVD